MSSVIICGSRTWSDWGVIRKLTDSLSSDTVVVHGAAVGADRIAGVCAKWSGLEVHEYPARWATFGKRAGIVRNADMLEKEKPTHVYAFTNNLLTSRGTRNMVERARAAGVPVSVLPQNPA